MVRSVDIRTKTGITNRPITRLYPLEVSLDDEHDNITVSDIDTNNVKSSEPVSATLKHRPVRAAALKARTVLKKWTK
jgi:hypothetical protein